MLFEIEKKSVSYCFLISLWILEKDVGMVEVREEFIDINTDSYSNLEQLIPDAMILYVALSTVLEKDEEKGSEERVDFKDEIIIFF